MLRPSFITARDIPDAWFQLLRECVAHGREYAPKASSTPAKRWELDFMSCHITHPGTRPFAPEIPAGLGIPGPIDEDYAPNNIQYYLTDVSAKGEHYTYGQDLAWQVEWCIKHYKEFGPNKHCYMTVGRPEMLYAYDDTVDMHSHVVISDRADDRVLRRAFVDNEYNRKEPGTSQCLRGVDTQIKDDKLHFSIHFRSWNLWNGLPANLACLQMVKEYMAQEIGVEDGEMFITSLKLGIVESCFDIAKLRTYLERG